jgi:hypothetical protein
MVRRMKCPESGKSIYWTIVEAERAAADFGMRAYECPSCKRWHLSSTKQRGLESPARVGGAQGD